MPDDYFCTFRSPELLSKKACYLLEGTLAETKWRGHLEKRPEGSCGSLLMGREAGNTRVGEGPPLVAGLDSPLSSLGRMGYLSSPGPLRFGRAAEAV